MTWRSMLLFAGSLAFAACATTAGLSSAMSAGAGGRDVLFAADLVHANAPTVYEAIVEVRPDFFDGRTPLRLHGSARRVRVYVNGVDVGDMDALHTIPLGPVTSVRYVGPGDAEFHWLHGGDGAAILVTTAAD